MFAFVSILLVAAVSSHKMFAAFDGESLALSQRISLDQPVIITLKPDSKHPTVLSLKVAQEFGQKRIAVSTNGYFNCVSNFGLNRDEDVPAHEFNLDQFMLTSKSPFLGTIKVGSGEEVRVAYIFVLPDGAKFDEETAVGAAYDFLRISKSSRDSLSIITLNILMEHLYDYRKARDNQDCQNRGFTALSVNHDGTFTYAYGLNTLQNPLQVEFSKYGGVQIFTNADVASSAGVSVLISTTDNVFLAVADHKKDDKLIRTYFLVNAQPKDIIALLEVLKLKDKTVNEVYSFAVELFKLAATHEVSVAKDFMSIPKLQRDLLFYLPGEQDVVMKHLKLHREARGNKDYNELGITALTVVDEDNVSYAYALQNLKTPLKVWLEGQKAFVQRAVGYEFPVSMSKHAESFTNIFFAVAQKENTRTYVLVNAKAKDIFTLLEVLKSGITDLNQVYEFSKKLFELAATNADVLSNLQLYRKAGADENSDVGITAITVTKKKYGGVSLDFDYSLSSYSFMPYGNAELWQVTVDEENGVVITKPVTSSAIFPAAMGEFNTLTVTYPAGAFIGVVSYSKTHSELTLIFVGMKPVHVLKLTEVSKSFPKELSLDKAFVILKEAFGAPRRRSVSGTRSAGLPQ